MEKELFEEYVKASEPGTRQKAYAWTTAIGLQAVDGLKTSEYLTEIAQKNIEGEITVEEANSLINSYYKKQKARSVDRIDEADKVSARIAQLILEDAFVFSVAQYVSIHKQLFEGVYDHAGKIRDYNISKSEWVLNGETVTYGNASDLKEMLEYDLSLEKAFDYKGLSNDKMVEHLARFVSNLWQIHAFGEGNTRATAVFTIKYLRTLGFDITNNEFFAKNSWYFRNALVRANYTNLKLGIHETTTYLELFFKNLLFDEKNELKNRNMHISGSFEKVDIHDKEVDIRDEKVDIRSVSKRTLSNIEKLKKAISDREYFGRSDVVRVLQLADSSASKFLKNMVEAGIIEPVHGHGKGKYKFN